MTARRVSGSGQAQIRRPRLAAVAYVYLPFCDTACYYCACNKMVTIDHGRSAKYIRYLSKELEMVSKLLDEPLRIELRQ